MKYCCDCYYMAETMTKDGKFKCENCRSSYDYVYPMDQKCYQFGEIFNSRRCESDKERLIRESKAARRYIVTIVSSLLGLAPDNKHASAFNYVREVILPSTEEGLEFLEDYDTNGIKVAKCLLDDYNRQSVAEWILYHFLTPFTKCVEENNIDEALFIYNNMYYDLKVRYGLAEPVPHMLKRSTV